MADKAARSPICRGDMRTSVPAAGPSADDRFAGQASARLMGLVGRRGRGRGRRGGGVRLLGVLRVLLLGVVLVGAVARGLLRLALALGRAVVRVVEARPLEVDRDGVEHPHDRRTALLAGGHGRVGHLLHDLEQMPVLAAVLVDRHAAAEYRRPISNLPPHMTDVATMDKIVSLCKRRGLIFPASEIYGGIANTYDYGHYGVLLKNNVVAQWWKAMIQERDDIVALDSAIIQHPRTWEASGHLAGFTDPLVDCRTCKLRFRADHLEEVRAGTAQHDGIRCGRAPSKLPGDHADCDLTPAREFNLMFETSIGPVKDAGSTVFLRPETAQGIFLNFKNTLQYARRKPPFGIAQIGKSFRNEITPGNFVFRTLEFEQMEMEFFVPPDEAQQWHEHWLQERMDW